MPSFSFQLRLCLSSFPRVETCFNTHYQNAYTNAFRNAILELLHLSSNSIVSTSREEGLVTALLHFAVWPVEQRSCRAHAFTLVGQRYKGISKQLCIYHLYRNVFLAQTLIRSHYFRHFKKAFLTLLCIYHLQKSPWSRLETLILRQKSDDKRTHKYTFILILLSWEYCSINMSDYKDGVGAQIFKPCSSTWLKGNIDGNNCFAMNFAVWKTVNYAVVELNMRSSCDKLMYHQFLVNIG